MNFGYKPCRASVLLVAGLALAFAACSPSSPSTSKIPEAWTSPVFSQDNLDSLAYFSKMDWVVATAKGTHDLIVLDAASGRMEFRKGRPGQGKGEFQRPNGIAVADNLLFVVERDNHRVQIFRLPEFLPLGWFGEEVLCRPYGIAIYQLEPDRYGVYVTDNYETAEGEIPPDHLLNERVKLFGVEIKGMELTLYLIKSFGDTTGRGILHKVESIALDELNNRVIIAEEEKSEMSLKVYSLSGEFTGDVIGSGIFEAEPEGLGLYAMGEEGYWIATDQHDKKSVFHVFDRKSLEYLGSFSGEKTANTDGIFVTNQVFSPFPMGAMFAIHDDRAVAAFPGEEICRKFGEDKD